MKSPQELAEFIGSLSPEQRVLLRKRASNPMTMEITTPFYRKQSNGHTYVVHRISRKHDEYLENSQKVLEALDAWVQMSVNFEAEAKATAITPDAATPAATAEMQVIAPAATDAATLSKTEPVEIPLKADQSGTTISEGFEQHDPDGSAPEVVDNKPNDRFTVAPQLPRPKEVFGAACLIVVLPLVLVGIYAATVRWPGMLPDDNPVSPQRDAAMSHLMPQLKNLPTTLGVLSTASVAAPVPLLRQPRTTEMYDSAMLPVAAAKLGAWDLPPVATAVEIGARTETEDPAVRKIAAPNVLPLHPTAAVPSPSIEALATVTKATLALSDARLTATSGPAAQIGIELSGRIFTGLSFGEDVTAACKEYSARGHTPPQIPDEGTWVGQLESARGLAALRDLVRNNLSRVLLVDGKLILLAKDAAQFRASLSHRGRAMARWNWRSYSYIVIENGIVITEDWK